MKRNFIIRNVILAILAIVIIVGTVWYFIYQNGRKYEIEKVENRNYFVLNNDNKMGVIDRSGNIIIDANYEDVKIPNPEKPLFACYNGDAVEILNANNEKILTDFEKVEPIRLESIASDLMYEKSVLKYLENGKYGLVSFDGKKITKPIYDEITGLPYKEGELLVKQNEKYGVINIKGNKLIKIEYDKIEVDGYYEESGYKYAGYIISNTTEEGYRYGYIDYKGNLVLEPEYNELSRIVEISDNENAYLLCAKNGQFGVMKNEKEIVPNEYQSIEYDENNQLLVVEKSKKYGISTLEGNLIVPAQYNSIDITGIYLYAQNDQGTTVYNSNGTEANIDTNMAILNTENEKYKIRIDNTNGTKYGVIGKDGEQIIEEKYNYIEYLYDRYFIVSDENSKLGVIDDKDNIKIEINNDSIQKVGDTKILQAELADEEITRLYKEDMSLICEMKNATVETKDNYIKIYNADETKYFSKEGKELKNSEVYTNNTLFAKKENDKWGFVNTNGDFVVEAKYDKVTEFNEYGFAAVKKDGKWGSINLEGKEVVEPTYELKEDKELSFIGKYYKVEYGFGESYYTENAK